MINKKFPELDYDPLTGDFRWAQKIRPSAKIGQIVGRTDKKGYRSISYRGKRYFAHRLAWEIYYDEPPAGILDHINRIKNDNRIANLRVVSASQNVCNRDAITLSGTKGVYWFRNRWVVHIKVDGKVKYFGAFMQMEDAANHARKKFKELHGDFSVY